MDRVGKRIPDELIEMSDWSVVPTELMNTGAPPPPPPGPVFPIEVLPCVFHPVLFPVFPDPSANTEK